MSAQQSDTIAPRVSVIVPVYNAAQYLDECLASIEGQSLSDVQIICVNDGSTDASAEILERHAKKDPRIQVITKPNGGYGSACNAGLDAAHGKWTAIVEPDDYIEAPMYKSMVDFAAKLEAEGSDVDIVKTPYWRIMWPDSENPSKRPSHFSGLVKTTKTSFKIKDEPVLLQYHPSIWSAIYKADFLGRNSIRFKEIPGAGWADNPFMAETLLRAENIVYLDAPFYCYRESDAESEARYLRSNPYVPVDRWLDIMEVVEQANITDAGVLEAIYLRGFNNLERIARSKALSDNDIEEVYGALCALMDPSVVLDSVKISATDKARVAKAHGIETFKGRRLACAIDQAKSRAHALRLIGPKDSIRMARERFTKS